VRSVGHLAHIKKLQISYNFLFVGRPEGERPLALRRR
jgi:hypothetical protein